MSSLLIASDLDRTLIYSRAAASLGGSIPADLVVVEHLEGEPLSFMTAAAANLLLGVRQRSLFVPVTTRTIEQLARVQLPGGVAPYAVAANGGFILCDGVVDEVWSKIVRTRLAGSATLAEVSRQLALVCRPEWTHKLREADDLFCYAVVDRDRMPGDVVATLADWAEPRGWRTSFQGRKLYVVPDALTKSAAVADIARRCDTESIVAAGDSLLDLDLLECSDQGIHPAHGEIFECGWSAAHVRSTTGSGAAAGEEICRWFDERARRRAQP